MEARTRVVHVQKEPYDIYIGRRQWCGKELYEASPWANYFSVKKYGLAEAIRRYEEKTTNTPELMARLPELRGKTLGCWCKPALCHGDVLVRLAEQDYERKSTLTEVEKSRLDKLAQKINAEHRKVESAMVNALQHARRAGKLLVEAKERTHHGGWLPWLEANFEGTERIAQMYMRVHIRWAEIEANTKSISDLTLTGALKAIGPPQGGIARVPHGEGGITRVPRSEGITRVPHKESAASIRDQVDSATACDLCGGSTLVPVPDSESATMLCPLCSGTGMDFIKETQAKIEAKPPRELGAIERLEMTPEGQAGLAEVNNEFEAEGLYLKMRSRIHDLYHMSRHMTPEEAAKREFAHYAADIARDTVKGRRHLGGIDQVRDAEAVREWLGDYAQALKDAEARLYEHHGS